MSTSPSKEVELLPCICGEKPSVNGDTSYSGGGRYKGATRCDSVKIRCEKKGCYTVGSVTKFVDYYKSPEECREIAIQEWNWNVAEQQEREASDDKEIWDLLHSDDKTKHALGRILSIIDAKETNSR